MKRAFSLFVGLSRIAAGLAFTVLAAAVVIQVFSRTFLPQSPVWTEELSRFALMFVVAFGVGLAIRSGDLVNVDLVLNALPEPLRRFFETVAFGLTTLLGVVIIGPALEFAAIGEMQTSPALDWRMDYIFAAIPLTAVMLAVFAAEKTWTVLRKRDGRTDTATR